MAHPRRIAAILLPALAGVIAERAHGGALEGRVVVVRPHDAVFRLRNTHRIAWASADLTALGIAPPMRVIDAQRIAPALDVTLVDERTLDDETKALAELLLALSPVVEPEQGVIHVDLTGIPARPHAVLEHARVILTAHGHVPALAMAPGKRLALALAHAAWLFRRGPVPPLIVVDDARRDEVIARLPLVVLPLSPDRISALHMLGLETAGDLMALRAHRLDARLADEARTLLDMLAGHDNAPVRGLVVDEHAKERVELDFGITRTEPLAFVLLPLLTRLTARLAARAERMVALEVTLETRALSFTVDDDRTPRPPEKMTFTLSFPSPVDDARALLKAVIARIESVFTLGREHDGEIVAIETVARQGARVPARQVAFDFVDEAPAADDDRALAALLAELVTELGEECVGRLVQRAALLPERMTSLSLSCAERHPVDDDASSAGRFLDGWPWPVRLLDVPVPLKDARVKETLPFAMIEGEDESDVPFSRAYRVLVLDDGRRALAFFDDEVGETLVHGWFD